MPQNNLNIIWKETLQDMGVFTSGYTNKVWYEKSSLEAINEGIVEIIVDNPIWVAMINKYHNEKLRTILSKYIGHKIYELKITHKQQGAEPTKKTETNLFGDENIVEEEIKNENNFNWEHPSQKTNQNKSGKNQSHPDNESKHHHNLNPKYTFDKFIIGNRNRLAFNASMSVADKPGLIYNPLYLYGGVGLGKTHLMQAIGNALLQKKPQAKIIYTSCENFVNEFVQHLRYKKIDDFKRKYRDIDLFLIDDIQFIAGKDGTQEEFFHTYEALYGSGKQIVMTSDKPPTEIKNLEARLSSRFAAGLVTDIQLPDTETRQAILISKCQEKGIELPLPIISYIADEVETNIRELEGALNSIAGHLLAENITNPTISDIRQALKKKGYNTHNKPAKKSKLDQIFEVICTYYEVELEEIKGKKKYKEIVKPRQVLMYLMKADINMTYPAIGKELGGRDHTTIMYAFSKIEKEIKKNEELMTEIEDLREKYYAGIKN